MDCLKFTCLILLVFKGNLIIDDQLLPFHKAYQNEPHDLNFLLL